MRQVGRISNWNDGKGFGFVTPHDGGPRAFVHIKAFQAATRRPLEGELISYVTTADAKGRVNATDVRFAGQRVQPRAVARAPRRRKPPMPIPRVAIGGLFLLAAIILMVMGVIPAALPLIYVLMSCGSYIAYVLDKASAGKNLQRVPEATLHMMDMLGGWPGGLIGQQQMRHKTAKASFRVTFWITVMLNLGLFAWLWRSGVAAALTDIVLE